MSPARSEARARPLLPGFASPPSSAGTAGSGCAAANSQTPYVGHTCRTKHRAGSRFCSERHSLWQGRGWAGGCGACAVPRSAALAGSAPRQPSRRGCLNAAHAVSEVSSAPDREGIAGDPAQRAGRRSRSRRRQPTRGLAQVVERVLHPRAVRPLCRKLCTTLRTHANTSASDPVALHRLLVPLQPQARLE